MITKSTLMRNSKSLHKQLFKQKEIADHNPIPLAKELSDLIKGSHSTTVARSDTLAREIASFTTNRQETDAIKEIRRALFVVESERVFSASGLFLSKLRCNLNDSSLDMLIFLKFYFARNNRLVKGQYCD